MSESDELEDEWDETAIDIRRFAVEQAIALRGPSDGLAQIFERADKIVEYIVAGG
jgi:hypothetical protein